MSGFRNVEKGAVFSVEDLVNYRKHQIISLTICDTQALRTVVFSFDAEEAITKEQTPNTELFTLLEGTMEVTAGKKSFLLKSGESILVSPEEEHSMFALEPCKMLQTGLK